LNNEEICDKFGMQARKHIESHYSLDTVFTTEYSLINHLTSP